MDEMWKLESAESAVQVRLTEVPSLMLFTVLHVEVRTAAFAVMPSAMTDVVKNSFFKFVPSNRFNGLSWDGLQFIPCYTNDYRGRYCASTS
jgi:hypothetical protein